MVMSIPEVMIDFGEKLEMAHTTRIAGLARKLAMALILTEIGTFIGWVRTI